MSERNGWHLINTKTRNENKPIYDMRKLMKPYYRYGMAARIISREENNQQKAPVVSCSRHFLQSGLSLKQLFPTQEKTVANRFRGHLRSSLLSSTHTRIATMSHWALDCSLTNCLTPAYCTVTSKKASALHDWLKSKKKVVSNRSTHAHVLKLKTQDGQRKRTEWQESGS